MCKWYPRHCVLVYVFVSNAHRVRGHTLVGPPTAFLRRGTGVPSVSLPGPTSVPSDAQADGIGDKAPTLWLLGCCVVVVVVCLFTSRSCVSWNTLSLTAEGIQGPLNQRSDFEQAKQTCKRMYHEHTALTGREQTYPSRATSPTKAQSTV